MSSFASNHEGHVKFTNMFDSIDDLNSTALQTSIIFHQVLCHKSDLNHGSLYFSIIITVSYQNLF